MGSLGEFAMCGFVSTQFSIVREAMCDLVLKGLVNAAAMMFLGAFFGFFLIDSMFYLEIRIGGVGENSHPILKHPILKTTGGISHDVPVTLDGKNPNKEKLMEERKKMKESGRGSLLELGPGK